MAISQKIFKFSAIIFISFIGLVGSNLYATECKSGKIDIGKGEDLKVTGACTVDDGTYHYGNVNIYGGGSLTFVGKGETKFWAKNIVVENNGSLIAGSPTDPFGKTPGQTLTIYLYGKDKGRGGSGVECIQTHCGIPDTIWKSDGSVKVDLENGVTDYFYQYTPLHGDNGDPNAYFGYKVLAVSFGGTLQLFGYKGANYHHEISDSYTAPSWVRLSKTVFPKAEAKDTELTVEPDKIDGNWKDGDQVVLTTTDYMPGHSELLTIKEISGNTLIVTANNAYTGEALNSGIQYPHNGAVYSLEKVPDRLHLDIKVNNQPAIETRAAVALLTRSIKIVSAGDNYGDLFPKASTHYYFGGHAVFRQGFKKIQIQGVEFKQLGQGGKMGHYPVHFHMARKVPKDTFVKDSSIFESMTRWITLHATEGVTLQRNVGFLSIGHGYYIEDGSEINNKLISNIGILARAAVNNIQNPREVPGILSAPDIVRKAGESVPYKSDAIHPTVFWMMNGWNDFKYNVAVGATACGMCYWMLPSKISGSSRAQKWDSYASLIKNEGGLAPLKSFVGNSCSSAYMSFNTISDTASCEGFFENTQSSGSVAVLNELAPDKWVPDPNHPGEKMINPKAKAYYPDVSGAIRATSCNSNSVNIGGGKVIPDGQGNLNCENVQPCSGSNVKNCTVNHIDKYISSFNTVNDINFSAIWLRTSSYFVTNSAITDVLGGGLTMVSGGGYTLSDARVGYTALVKQSVFVGQTQNDDNPFAMSLGPVNNKTNLNCNNGRDQNPCILKDEGVSYLISNFNVGQRLLSIYDGPMQQDSNAYLDIKKRPIQLSDKFLFRPVLGIPKDVLTKQCYLPNAAIGWKQPNGFYYPPSFHSTNLFFDNVDIRHFVIVPRFIPGTAKTISQAELDKMYCTSSPSNMFTGYSDVDRQTFLNDDDGSLTGYKETISISEDPFFKAPVEQFECLSEKTAKTSPYQYITTAVIPGDYKSIPISDSRAVQTALPWTRFCTNFECFGVPLYRQILTNKEFESGDSPYIIMAGQGNTQRSTLTLNHGIYFMDTTLSKKEQEATPSDTGSNAFIKTSVFERGKTYNVLFLYTTAETKQTYQIYVGKDYQESETKAFKTQLTSDDFNFQSTAWPEGWSKSFKDGILTVNIDMSHYASLFNKAKEAECNGNNVCSWNSSKNVCGCNSLSPYYNQCIKPLEYGQRTTCSWSGNDAPCPEGGCVGFSFTLPTTGFDNDNLGKKTIAQGGHRPNPIKFSDDKAYDWNIKWDSIEATKAIAGKCYQNKD